MPKNGNGEVKCINHTEQTMIKKVGEAIMFNAERGPTGIYNINEQKVLSFHVYYCSICGYVEKYMVPMN